MGQYRLDSIEQLARQMRFTPIPRRLEQLNSAEDLLLKLCPEQTYTLHEVTCAITGYETKHDDGALLTGIALQHDLGLLLEDVSESLQIHINASPDPVLTIEEVAQRLSVTSKTVQRWRRRGLPARRYTFADGKRRIGFRSNSLQRFVGSPSGTQQVTPAPSTGRDLAWLMARCHELALAGYWDMLAGQRLASEAGLSPLAIVELVRQQSGIVFAAEPGPGTRARIMEMREAGTSLRRIAGTLSLPVYGVYRIILEQKLHCAIRKRIRFYDDPLYHEQGAPAAINAIINQEPIAAPNAEENRIPRDLPPYLRDLYRIPLLTPNRERGLFLQYHYLRLLAFERQKNLDPQVSTFRDLKRFDGLRRQARLIRAQIVEANLRLVVSVARKHVRPSVSLMELVSEGNVTLIRAVDSFDIHRGHRFSTYAVYALMRGFARYVPAALVGQKQLADPELFATVRDPATSRQVEQILAREEVGGLLSRLEPRERDVLAGRYGISSQGAPLTCRELGSRLNLSSQRIVQIEQQAMSKLRSI